MEEIDRWNSQEWRFRRWNFFNREEKPSDWDENLSQREQNSSSDINLPQEFKFLPHQESFSKVFENISKWYWNTFSSEEIKIIADIRNKKVHRFESHLDEKKILNITNEIDGYLFKSRNDDLKNIENNVISKIKDPNMKRQFREVAINLKEKKGHNLSKDEGKVIEILFLKAKNNNEVPNANYIFSVLDNDYSMAEILLQNWDDIEPTNYSHQIVLRARRFDGITRIWSTKKEENKIDVIDMVNAFGDPQLDEIVRTSINDYCFQAIQILNKLYNNYYDRVLKSRNYDINQIIYEVAYEQYGRFGAHGPIDSLRDALYERIEKIDPNFFRENMVSNRKKSLNSDFYIPESIQQEIKNDQEALEDINYLINVHGFSEDEAWDIYTTYYDLKTRVGNGETLTEEERIDFYKYSGLFGIDWNWWYLRKARKLKELRDLQARQTQEFTPNTVPSVEYTAWNIKDIRPDAIVENNEWIRNYIYWDNVAEDNKNVDNISFSALSNEDKRKFFQQLINENKSDIIFMDSIRYLDEYGNIDRQKAIADGIDEESLEINRAKIEHMILELAKEEALSNWEKSRINEIYIKKSSMLCCFRAISKFFDTVNNNWENFASEFKIDDLNNDIHFDEETWMITMEWTIWANQNHIKLYYNTKTWTLEFDNFLAYNSQDDCYKIWKWNWEREKINIVLPTMDEMQHQAKSINFDLINNFTSNAQIISRFVSKTQMYEHMVGLAMRESIWTNCFKWFMWADMEVNKYFVQQFNEKNILKQDIINSIYSKFYERNDMKEKLDGCLVISAGNEPEQFKLIKLISDTIDNCWSCSALLRFRNAVNWLDDILTNNHDLVEKDDLLRYLFADNLSNREDLTDISRNIIWKENEDIAVSRDNQWLATYASNEEYDNKWNRTLNYYTFLDLLSENKSSEKLINIDTFETALSTITTSWKYLLSDEQWLLWKNYAKKRDEWILPDFKKQKELARIEKEMDKAYDNPN